LTIKASSKQWGWQLILIFCLNTGASGFWGSATNRSFADFYINIKCIGRGKFGEAATVKSKTDGKKYVMKKEVVPLEGKDRRRDEVQALKRCNHVNIVKYFDYFFEKGDSMIVMEYCSGGDLARVLHNQKKIGNQFDDGLVRDYAFDLASAMQYMRSVRIIHRDLKPANIFISSENSLKIGDFGLARCLDRSSEMASTKCGTPCYMAPEILYGQPYNHRADLWSLGCVLYELCTLEKAFDGDSYMALMLAITSAQYKPIPFNSHSLVAHWVPKLLLINPLERILADNIIERNSNSQPPSTFRQHLLKTNKVKF